MAGGGKEVSFCPLVAFGKLNGKGRKRKDCSTLGSVSSANSTLNKNKDVPDVQTFQTFPSTAHFLPESGELRWGLGQHPLC